MSKWSMHNCSLCSQKFVGEQHAVTLNTGRELAVCQDCWNVMREATSELTEREQQANALFEALLGYREVVINRDYGGFALSEAAKCAYLDSIGIRYELRPHNSRDLTANWGRQVYLSDGTLWMENDIDRDDPALVRVVKEMGEAANGRFARLRIVKIPEDVDWFIDGYDGLECIREYHRTWV